MTINNLSIHGIIIKQAWEAYLNPICKFGGDLSQFGMILALTAWVVAPLLEWSRPLEKYTAGEPLSGRAPARVVALLQEAFGGLPGVGIGCRIARWKGLRVYFPTQVEFFNLELIWPVKNQISQDWSKSAQWGCLKEGCCCNQLLKTFLNPKLSSG